MNLRKLLDSPRMVIAPGAFNAMTAMLVEQAGFPAVYMTGGGTSMAHGYPDLGLLTLTEMVQTADQMVASVSIPLIADADTGFGNRLNVVRTVREYERRGVAAVHLEDQVFPKRCGHLVGKEVIQRDEWVSSIKAAVQARTAGELLIIARTDARSVLGYAEAIDRANAALEVGADIAFVEAPQSREEIALIPKEVQGPCVVNVVPNGRSPNVALPELEQLGYKLAIVPGVLVTAILAACDAALADLGAGRYPGSESTGPSIVDIFRRFGLDAWEALRQQP